MANNDKTTNDLFFIVYWTGDILECLYTSSTFHSIQASSLKQASPPETFEFELTKFEVWSEI